VQSTALDCSSAALHYTSLHITALHSTALHSTTQHYTVCDCVGNKISLISPRGPSRGPQAGPAWHSLHCTALHPHVNTGASSNFPGPSKAQPKAVAIGAVLKCSLMISVATWLVSLQATEHFYHLAARIKLAGRPICIPTGGMHSGRRPPLPLSMSSHRKASGPPVGEKAI
jgi:hypothetical protein